MNDNDFNPDKDFYINAFKELKDNVREDGDFNQEKSISARDKLRKLRRRRLEEVMEDINLRKELDDYKYYQSCKNLDDYDE